ncbi:unnamed protein product [Didymodactylos carnosus]|uniref:Uncharacterized protein n=1 Tax=Didymodactylos carnosus TaxID=1234261 RepID=A0A814NUM7_9BILA|nr:unnamed protein product [Didymodactylos carnosus]CAF1344785.1 unnamed protein product [Didymodactylos carnosus]CAF3863854.1 unnamed protein product [Didymodactylos carnosus]CAF4155759.1 unnamed protein product [Didymodactylos carnosus]
MYDKTKQPPLQVSVHVRKLEEEIIDSAYATAVELIKQLSIIPTWKKNDIFKVNDLSEFISKQLKTKSNLGDNSQMENTDDDGKFELDDDDDDQKEEEDLSGDEETDGNEKNSDEEDEIDVNNIRTIKTDLHGMRIRNEKSKDQQNCYFKIKISGTEKFLHKQTACFLLTNENSTLSSDRLSRVM